MVFQKQAAGVNAQNPNPHYHKKTVDMMGQKIPVFGQVVYAASISTEEKQSTRVYTKGSVHKTKDLGPAKELSLKGGASIQTPVNTLCVFSGRSVHSGPSEAPVYRRFLVAMNDIFSQMIDFSKGVY